MAILGLFAKLMKSIFTYREMPHDGKCLYHSVLESCDIFASVDDLIDQVAQSIEGHPEDFKDFISSKDVKLLQDDLTAHHAAIIGMRTRLGDKPELKALAGLLHELGIDRPIWIYCYNSKFSAEGIEPADKYGGSDPIKIVLSGQRYGLLLPKSKGKKRAASVDLTE